ncbi:hypothetical protein B9Z55_000141 [Caenorhabditis nigoni]|uniref:Uncharacterized protein n=1 Tax=Caenorhabditis nigoni TaxID=1611254 RepID=A0A2G5VFL9_9PELO|nr:hypothetical protein B9Z55_000141 [Caenorhabditis nigoni]
MIIGNYPTIVLSILAFKSRGSRDPETISLHFNPLKNNHLLSSLLLGRASGDRLLMSPLRQLHFCGKLPDPESSNATCCDVVALVENGGWRMETFERKSAHSSSSGRCLVFLPSPEKNRTKTNQRGVYKR